MTSSQKLDINTKNGYGINGYDVVSYFERKPQKGNENFQIDHNGVLYKFSSKRNKLLFEKEPEKYLPQYGGYCAYAIGKRNMKMKIDPETFRIINGKLYLFYNFWLTNTLKLWNEEKGIKDKADQNWEKLRYK